MIKTGFFERTSHVIATSGPEEKIYVRTIGFPSTSPIVLLHGAWQESSFFEQTPQFAELYTRRFVVLPDWPGHGRLAWMLRGSEDTPRLQDYAVSLAAVLAYFELSHITLYAASRLARLILHEYLRTQPTQQVAEIVLAEQETDVSDALPGLATRQPAALQIYSQLRRYVASLTPDPASDAFARAFAAALAVPPHLSIKLARWLRATEQALPDLSYWGKPVRTINLHDWQALLHLPAGLS